MKFQISVIKTGLETKPTTKGTTYQVLELTYKRLDTGKIESKKLMSFAGDAFKMCSDAKMDDAFEVTSEKNEKTGYWDWSNVIALAPGAALVSQSQGNNGSVASSPRASTYETPEERAKKQIYIVKQSAIAQAVALLSVGAKIPPSTDLVLKQAQEFVDFVFAEKSIALADLQDDIPD